MIAAFETLREAFRTFGMNGINMVLVCAAMLFCMVEKKKLGQETGRLAGYGVLFFILLGNPFGYQIIASFWMKEYWKIFMLLLPVIFVAVFILELVSGQKKLLNKIIMFACCVGIVACSTFFDFDAARIDRISEGNAADAEIAAVDEVIRESQIVPQNMIAPREVCARIREVNPGIKLLYGEEMIQGMIDKTLVSEDETEQQFIDACAVIVAVPDAVDYQITVANTYNSNCIVLEHVYDDAACMEDAGFLCYGKTEKYAVYFRK